MTLVIAVVAQIVFTLALSIGSVYFLFRWIGSGQSRSIVRRLGKRASVVVKASQTWGVWNPAKPNDTFNAIYGPGVATYRMDDMDIVHLNFRPKGNPGEIALSGPIPESLIKKSSNQRKQEKILLVYFTALIVVFGLTFVLSSGTTSARLVRGGVAVVIAMIALVFAVRLLLIVLSTTTSSRSKMKVPEQQGAAAQPVIEPKSSDPHEIWRRVERNEQIARRYLEEHEGPNQK